MSLQLRDVKQRIGTTSEIRKVTTALQRVSAARLARERREIDAFRAYAVKFARLVRMVVAAVPEARNPFTHPTPGAPMALLVFGTDRGLCGGYAAALLDEVRAFARGHDRKPLELVSVGELTTRRARLAGLRIADTYAQPLTRDRLDFLDMLSKKLTGDYLSGRFGEVHILYTEYISGLRQTPIVNQLLPFDLSARPDRGMGMLSFEPPPDQLLERLMPEFIRLSIEQAFRSSMASENSARQAAMSRAADNAGDLIDDLRQDYSRLRQENITSEMLEIVAGTLDTE
jgi:F-type H+-transporting ATPase subunit gamma